MHQSFEVFWSKILLNYHYDFMNIFLYMMDFFSMINKNRVGSLSVFIFNGDNIFIYPNFRLFKYYLQLWLEWFRVNFEIFKYYHKIIYITINIYFLKIYIFLNFYKLPLWYSFLIYIYKMDWILLPSTINFLIFRLEFKELLP